MITKIELLKKNHEIKNEWMNIDVKHSEFKSIKHCESNFDKIIQAIRSSKRINHENDQSDHVNIKFSIKFNKFILSNKFRNVCTIEHIDWLYKQKFVK